MHPLARWRTPLDPALVRINRPSRRAGSTGLTSIIQWLTASSSDANAAGTTLQFCTCWRGSTTTSESHRDDSVRAERCAPERVYTGREQPHPLRFSACRRVWASTRSMRCSRTCRSPIFGGSTGSALGWPPSGIASASSSSPVGPRPQHSCREQRTFGRSATPMVSSCSSVSRPRPVRLCAWVRFDERLGRTRRSSVSSPSAPHDTDTKLAPEA